MASVPREFVIVTGHAIDASPFLGGTPNRMRTWYGRQCDARATGLGGRTVSLSSGWSKTNSWGVFFTSARSALTDTFLSPVKAVVPGPGEQRPPKSGTRRVTFGLFLVQHLWIPEGCQFHEGG